MKCCRGKKKRLIAILLFTAAAALIVYPLMAYYLNENAVSSVIASLKEAQGEDDEVYEEALAAARAYNEELADGNVKLKDFYSSDTAAVTEEYYSLLNMTDSGIMGYIEIPSIDLELPIYHGTDDSSLANGAGHLMGTSLPVGGESTHAVLSGHTGLSVSRLFTDISQLTYEDVFYIHIFGQTLCYEVDLIKVVLPDETDDLQIVSGEDYCTLVTCTPYGINSHRLLVRGSRISEADADELASSKETSSLWIEKYVKALKIGMLILIGGTAAIVIVRKTRRKQRNE